MTRHPYLSNADGPDCGDVGAPQDRLRIPGNPSAERAPKTGQGKYPFVPQVVDNLLNNELHVQAGLVPTNT